jgi:hypothetical protein
MTNQNQIILLARGLKMCPKCKITKSINDFPENKTRTDGHSSTCKECDKAHQREYQHKHREEILSKKKDWYWSHRQEAASRANRPEIKAYKKKWGDEHKEKQYFHNKAQRAKFPEKIRARDAVYRAILKGILPHVKTLKCFNCGDRASEYHHHKGYDKKSYLDVVPVCRNCHNILEHW